MKYLLLLILIYESLWSMERTQVHMGTMISVTVADQEVSDAVFDLFSYLDKTLSTYKKDSEISHLNKHGEANVSTATHEVLKRSLEMYRLSGGAFDVTIGSLTHNAYRFGYADEHLPSAQEVERLAKFVGSGRIRITETAVHLLPGTVIDLGGIGKGFAVDRAVELMVQKGVSGGVVAASGDIGCLGPCEIRVQDPFHADGSIALITSALPRFAISTSGNYERYIRTKANNHLIDPKTHKPQQRYASITLMDSGDNTRLDALATAVSVMDEDKALSMLATLGIGYLLIRNDGRVVQSPSIKGVMIHTDY